MYLLSKHKKFLTKKTLKQESSVGYHESEFLIIVKGHEVSQKYLMKYTSYKLFDMTKQDMTRHKIAK